MSEIFKRGLLPALVAAVFGVGASGVNAAIVVNNTDADPICDVAAVTLDGSAPPSTEVADYCIGFIEKLGDPDGELAALNDRTDEADWDFVYKIEAEDTETGGFFTGIEFTLTSVDIDEVSGDWTINWADRNGEEELNLPVYVDIAAAFKAGDSIAYFLFDDYLLTDNPYAATGTFTLSAINKDLSHESLFIRLGSAPIPPEEIPEPSTLVLFGAALVSLGYARRWRRS